MWRGVLVAAAEAFAEDDTHQAVLRDLPARSARVTSLAEENGPYTRPLRKPSKLSVKRFSIRARSTATFGVSVIFLPRTSASKRSPTATFRRTEAGSVTWNFYLTLTSGTVTPPMRLLVESYKSRLHPDHKLSQGKGQARPSTRSSNLGAKNTRKPAPPCKAASKSV